MFKTHLNNIKDTIDNFTGDRSTLMYSFIQRKLNRSFETYVKEINEQVNYLLSRNENKVRNKIYKRKGE